MSIEDREIKFTRNELIQAIEYYYNDHMRATNKSYLSVKKLEISKNRSSKYLCGFEVGKK